jgi:hypothetical protein
MLVVGLFLAAWTLVGVASADGNGMLYCANDSLAATKASAATTTDHLRPDGPVGTPAVVIVMLVVLGMGTVAVLATVGTLIYLGVSRLNRRRRAGPL